MVAVFVALMFVGLVLTDLGVEKWRARRAQQPAEAAPATRHPAMPSGLGLEALCTVPEGLSLGDQHAWFEPDFAEGFRVGADALIAHVVGAMSGIMLPKVGDLISVGQPLFRLENHGRTLAIPAAIEGRVTGVNTCLADHPDLFSSDPYNHGWVCHLTPTHRNGQTVHMRAGKSARHWMEGEFIRLQEFLFGQIAPDVALGATSQDGGTPTFGCLGELDQTAWSNFEAEFLRRK
jgi:glycine cleavage system H protein